MNDIVKMLRDAAPENIQRELLNNAADEIERYRAAFIELSTGDRTTPLYVPADSAMATIFGLR
jgi:hypothetical protein